MNNMTNTYVSTSFYRILYVDKILKIYYFFPAVSYRLPLAVTMFPEQQKPGRSNTDT